MDYIICRWKWLLVIGLAPLILWGLLRTGLTKYEFSEVQFSVVGDTLALITFDNDNTKRFYHIQIVRPTEQKTLVVNCVLPTWPPAELVLSPNGRYFAYAANKQIHVLDLLEDKTWAWPLPERFSGGVRFPEVENTVTFLSETNDAMPKPLFVSVDFTNGETIELVGSKRRGGYAWSQASQFDPVKLKSVSCYIQSDFHVVAKDPNTNRTLYVTDYHPNRYRLLFVTAALLAAMAWWLLWVHLGVGKAKSTVPWIQVCVLHAIAVLPFAARILDSRESQIVMIDSSVQLIVAVSCSILVYAVSWITTNPRAPAKLTMALLVLAVFAINHKLLHPWLTTHRLAARMLIGTTLLSAIIFVIGEVRFFEFRHRDTRQETTERKRTRRSKHGPSIFIRDILAWTILFAILFVSLRSTPLRLPMFRGESQVDVLLVAIACCVSSIRFLWVPISKLTSITLAVTSLMVAACITSLVLPPAFEVPAVISITGIALAILSGHAFYVAGYSYQRKTIT